MKVLMFGWEFPPYNHGGLGTACHGLVRGLLHHGVNVYFVLPKILGNGLCSEKKMTIIDASEPVYRILKNGMSVPMISVDSTLLPYQTCEEYDLYLEQVTCQKLGDKNIVGPALYGQNLFEEVNRYAEKAAAISEIHDHNLIHAHDWMTFKAAEIAKKRSKQAMVVHVHATEFDRTGGNPSQRVYDIERRGMEQADHIIAVSDFTKQKIVKNYGISPDKIDIVHNAVDISSRYFREPHKLNNSDKIVLFLGRMTLQKGPDYFLHMAKKVLEKKKRVKFIMAGSGDMMKYIIHKAALLGISKNVLFTGFLRGEEIDRVYQMADLYVMPSVSEPFGITSLEAIKNGTPVLFSKQSGVSEVIVNALKVDFWDIDEMTNKVLAVLTYAPLHNMLKKKAKKELEKISWHKQGEELKKVYGKVLTKKRR